MVTMYARRAGDAAIDGRLIEGRALARRHELLARLRGDGADADTDTYMV